MVPHGSAALVAHWQVPLSPLYIKHLNTELNEKPEDAALVLPPCIPGTDQPDVVTPVPSPASSPMPVPAPVSTESSSSSSVGLIIGAVAGGVAAVGASVCCGVRAGFVMAAMPEAAAWPVASCAGSRQVADHWLAVLGGHRV